MRPRPRRPVPGPPAPVRRRRGGRPLAGPGGLRGVLPGDPARDRAVVAGPGLWVPPAARRASPTASSPRAGSRRRRPTTSPSARPSTARPGRPSTWGVVAHRVTGRGGAALVGRGAHRGWVPREPVRRHRDAAETLRTFRVTTSSMTPTAGPGNSASSPSPASRPPGPATRGLPSPARGDLRRCGHGRPGPGRRTPRPDRRGGTARCWSTAGRLAEPWLAGSAAATTGVFGPVTVPDGDYYLLGDAAPTPATAVSSARCPVRPGGRRGADRARPPGVGLPTSRPGADGVDTGLHNMTAQGARARTPPVRPPTWSASWPRSTSRPAPRRRRHLTFVPAVNVHVRLSRVPLVPTASPAIDCGSELLLVTTSAAAPTEGFPFPAKRAPRTRVAGGEDPLTSWLLAGTNVSVSWRCSTTS